MGRCGAEMDKAIRGVHGVCGSVHQRRQIKRDVLSRLCNGARHFTGELGYILFWNQMVQIWPADPAEVYTFRQCPTKGFK
jgi:hypothetical protein